MLGGGTQEEERRGEDLLGGRERKRIIIRRAYKYLLSLLGFICCTFLLRTPMNALLSLPPRGPCFHSENYIYIVINMAYIKTEKLIKFPWKEVVYTCTEVEKLKKNFRRGLIFK